MADEDVSVVIHKPNIPQSSSQELEEEEEEEALSLCDLPLNDMSSVEIRPSSSETSELFEFFNNAVSDMCPADEIFYCGKLEPLKHKPNSNSPHIDYKPERQSNQPNNNILMSDPTSGLRSPVSRSYSMGTCSNSPRSVMVRNSRSLDSRKLRRSSSSDLFLAQEVQRNSSTVKRPTKPRWYSVMFGTVKVPEMQLSDIKNRQLRRTQSTTMFPPVIDGEGKMAENRSTGKVSWGILRAFSCKDRRSVSVTASLAVPQAT